jgi:hypothetical protein
MGTVIEFPIMRAAERYCENPEGTLIVLPVVRVERAPDTPDGTPSKPRRRKTSLLQKETA